LELFVSVAFTKRDFEKLRYWILVFVMVVFFTKLSKKYFVPNKPAGSIKMVKSIMTTEVVGFFLTISKLIMKRKKQTLNTKLKAT
jgi:hypothetical protein